MAYLKFNKAELVNLEYSLKREVLSSNRSGGYSNTTIVGCNTRKYHGLFVLPIDRFEGRKHILLSAVDESLIQHEHEFNLGIRSYGDIYEPRGHKYIVDFELGRSCDISYRVGGMLFRKSMLFLHDEERLLIKYTLLEAHSETVLRIKPFLAFRDIHSLTKANPQADTRYEAVTNGCRYRMYEGFPDLFLQFNKPVEYIHNPNWYYGVTYREEQRRGFESSEDLYVPGMFEMPIQSGESIILSVSTAEMPVKSFSRHYDKEFAARMGHSSYRECLRLAAKQCISRRDGVTSVVSGYSWLDNGLRQSLLALPGLTLFNDGDQKTFKDIVKGIYAQYDGQLYGGSKQADAALLLFRVAQLFGDYLDDHALAWKTFSKVLLRILDTFLKDERIGVELHGNGLLWTRLQGVALSWMNAYDCHGNPVTERSGYQVEMNALWYNALCYVIDSVKGSDRKGRLVQQAIAVRDRIKENFYPMFWVEERGHLADYIGENGYRDISTRPNQILTCTLPYSPIDETVQAQVLRSIEKELLTTRGVRTLSPKNPLYKGVYEGNQDQRDHAYHQGSTRTWLIGFFIEASFRLYGKSFVRKAEELVAAFEEDMTIHGLGCIAELYDGDPPHFPHGAISYSVSAAELLRAFYLIEKYKEDSL
ncbi:MAG: glycogen debranching enzyme family protein [Bacteroidales bacterium]|nr:glycogen debranching enzyme family protein [Bacteroidales bacterium]